MTSEIEIHRAERNVEAYALAAQHLAEQMKANGYGEILFCPGDATAYPFVILPAGRTYPTVFGDIEDGVHMATSRDDTAKYYRVILAASFGSGYEWGGHTMDWGYCAEKWSVDGREWTGRVVCALLNALSPLLKADT